MTLKRKVVSNSSRPALIRAVQFQAVTFFDTKADRQIVILYALGSDGIVREYNNNKWLPFPIEAE